jgi:hypothetical protein
MRLLIIAAVAALMATPSPAAAFRGHFGISFENTEFQFDDPGAVGGPFDEEPRYDGTGIDVALTAEMFGRYVVQG